MSKIKVRCNYCGKEIERYPSQVLSSVYCSRKCLSDYKREHHNITFNCEQCHKSVTVKKGNYVGRKNHFCSQECKNKWQIENLKRENNPFYNKTHKEKSKIAISKTKKSQRLLGRKAHNYNQHLVECVECGKKVYKIEYLVKRNKYQFCSKECHYKWKSENLIGENSPTWNPNITNEERVMGRNYPEYTKFKKLVMKRDNYTCDVCGQVGSDLNVHHLNGYHWDKENRVNINNGVTICEKCHRKFHNNYGYRNNTKKEYKEFKESV